MATTDPRTRHCPSCEQPRRPTAYLCRTCWNRLPVSAQAALCRRDNTAFRRLAELHEQLRAGRALARIKITP